MAPDERHAPAPPSPEETPAGLSPTERFLAMERRHGFFDDRVLGWSPWRVMRGALQRISVSTSFFPTRPALSRSIEALVATVRLIGLALFGRRRTLLVKTCRSALRMREGDHYRDVYFDGLLDRGHSFLKLEEINSPDFDRQAAAARYPGNLNPVAFTFWGRVLGMLFPVRAARPFCERVARALHEDLGIETSAAWLMMRVSTVHWQAWLYERLLAGVRPRAVLVSDTAEFGLRLACARRGIPFIELQHGVFDANHPDAVPSHVRGSFAELLLPDHLASRGEFWIEQLAGTRQGEECAVPVGNELLDRARLAHDSRDSTGERSIVFTGQGWQPEQAAAWLEGAVASAPEGLAWSLKIKLHPTYDRDPRPYDGLRADPRVEVIGGADDPNVFDLLARADLHVSISSACLFDAAAIGVPSALLPLPTYETLLYAADGRALTVLERPADLWTLLGHASLTRTERARFAAPGFIDRLEALALG